MAVQNVNFPAANNLQKNVLDGKANMKRCRKIWGSQTQPGSFPSTQLTLRGVPMDVLQTVVTVKMQEQCVRPIIRNDSL